MTAPELSVVVLCYRGGHEIVPYVNGIAKQLVDAGVEYEIVLVANYDAPPGSDPTPEVAAGLSAKNRRIVTVSEAKQGRMGWDLHRGLAAARGRYVGFVDGDGETAARDIVRLYAAVVGAKSDFGKLYRLRRADSLLRQIVSAIFNLLFSVCFPIARCRDINGKPKILSATALARMQLTSTDWFADAEIVLEAHRLRLSVTELAGEGLKSTWHTSFIGFSAVLEFMKNLLVYRIRYWFFRRRESSI